jgi:hypothetical protein
MVYKVEVMPQEIADNYYEMLFRFSMVIKQLKLKYWLEGGTLIGAIREGAILSWDKDVDVSMLESDRKILWENKNTIKKFGLKTNYTDSIYRIDFKNVYMDIFSYELKNGIYQEINWRNRTRWPESYYKPKQLFPLKNAKLGPLIQPVPNLSKNFLKQAYGDWHVVPKKFSKLPKLSIGASKKLTIWIMKNNKTNNKKLIKSKPNNKKSVQSKTNNKKLVKSKTNYFIILVIFLFAALSNYKKPQTSIDTA